MDYFGIQTHFENHLVVWQTPSRNIYMSPGSQENKGTMGMYLCATENDAWAYIFIRFVLQHFEAWRSGCRLKSQRLLSASFVTVEKHKSKQGFKKLHFVPSLSGAICTHPICESTSDLAPKCCSGPRFSVHVEKTQCLSHSSGCLPRGDAAALLLKYW